MECCGYGKDGYVRSEVAKRRHFLSSIALARLQLPYVADTICSYV
uniref:Uncharacterized protein n=1 Tax=Magnetococcus massalia (strain MO-1) TaxID=451514 RepID=A0A1S7LFE4_MAGMO|nr:protein of unknown function [Candidatus Magnetococcus massalia]